MIPFGSSPRRIRKKNVADRNFLGVTTTPIHVVLVPVVHAMDSVCLVYPNPTLWIPCIEIRAHLFLTYNRKHKGRFAGGNATCGTSVSAEMLGRKRIFKHFRLGVHVVECGLDERDNLPNIREFFGAMDHVL